LESYIPAIIEWANKYCVKVNAAQSKNPRGGSFSAGSRQKKYKVQISKVLEIEENILSLMYGLKGLFNVTSQWLDFVLTENFLFRKYRLVGRSVNTKR
jgi:hypothetical protein